LDGNIIRSLYYSFRDNINGFALEMKHLWLN